MVEWCIGILTQGFDGTLDIIGATTGINKHSGYDGDARLQEPGQVPVFGSKKCICWGGETLDAVEAQVFQLLCHPREVLLFIGPEEKIGYECHSGEQGERGGGQCLPVSRNKNTDT